VARLVWRGAREGEEVGLWVEGVEGEAPPTVTLMIVEEEKLGWVLAGLGRGCSDGCLL
jgi:hypothetical protein